MTFFRGYLKFAGIGKVSAHIWCGRRSSNAVRSVVLSPIYGQLSEIFAPTHWKLRQGKAVVNRTQEELCVRQHPDQTFIRSITKGFEFLGYIITSSGQARAARKTCEKFVARVNQLSEQSASQGRIGDYINCWRNWGLAGVRELFVCDDKELHRRLTKGLSPRTSEA